jgi:hypothetical protein
MGKVASQSIEYSLRRRSDLRGHTFLRPHFISDEGIKFYQEAVKNNPNHPHHQQKSIQEQVLVARRAQKILANPERTKIITGVREPCSHQIAGFFQNLRSQLGERWRPMEPGEKIQDDVMEAIYDWWEEKVNNWKPESQVGLRRGFMNQPASFFDKEFKQVTEIDVYEHPFDHNKGYSILRLERTDLLIYKLENGPQSIEQGLSEFFNIPDLQLSKTNVGAAKPYSSYYEKFINTVNVSSEILDAVYDSKYVKHFYRPEEILSFQNRWKKI